MTAQPERYLMPFEKPGQTLNLADIQTLKLGEAGSTKGLVVMRIQTEWPEGAFTAVAFGDVELVNEVPYGTREFNPMQSLKLATSPNIEGQSPTSGFFVSSPEDGNLSTLVVSGAELSFGSTALLTSLQGGLTIQTVWGAVGVWLIDKFMDVIQGSRLDLTEQEIEQSVLDRYPGYDPAYETLKRALDKYYGSSAKEDPAGQMVTELLKRYGSPQNIPPDDPAGKYVNDLLKKYRALEALRRKQKRWKGGWWKMTYGPVAVSGQCTTEAAGDGGTGGDGQPYTTEIPICRGNNGNTILMYESGVSYDRVGPNLFAQSFISEFDLYGNGNYTTEPQNVDPPVEGQYQVRLGTLSKTCDPAAEPFAPSFTTASLSRSPENKLVVDAASINYEPELSTMNP